MAVWLSGRSLLTRRVNPVHHAVLRSLMSVQTLMSGVCTKAKEAWLFDECLLIGHVWKAAFLWLLMGTEAPMMLLAP